MRTAGIATLAAAILSACAVGPDFVAPALPATSSGAFATDSTTVDRTQAPPDDWWRLYDDAMLSAFVAEALRANTDLRAAMANLTQARAAFREAHAGEYPTTQLGAGEQYGRNLIADSIAGATHHDAKNVFTDLGAIDVAYEIDLFGRVSRTIEAARADAEAAQAVRDAVQVTVAAETTRAYTSAVSASHELVVAKRSVEIADAAIAIVERQVAAGAASEFDLARVRVVAHQARAQLPALEGRHRTAVLELAALLGRTPAQAPNLASDIERDASISGHKPLALPVGDGVELLARRPDVRQAERRLAAATARIGVATSGLYPRVSFGASLGYASNSILKNSNSFTVGIGPLVSWTFPNQAVARARIAQTNAAATAALATFDGTVLRALKETEQAIVALDSERTRRVELAAAEAEADRSYRIASMRRREGSLSQLDLLTSEQSLIAASAALAASDTRIADAQVTLFKALGGGWRTSEKVAQGR
jgi:NodT family efflux transporter outer membrane factor (OMF) lipoprotein